MIKKNIIFLFFPPILNIFFLTSTEKFNFIKLDNKNNEKNIETITSILKEEEKVININKTEIKAEDQKVETEQDDNVTNNIFVNYIPTVKDFSKIKDILNSKKENFNYFILLVNLYSFELLKELETSLLICPCCLKAKELENSTIVEETHSLFFCRDCFDNKKYKLDDIIKNNSKLVNFFLENNAKVINSFIKEDIIPAQQIINIRLNNKLELFILEEKIIHKLKNITIYLEEEQKDTKNKLNDKNLQNNIND